MKIVLMLQTTIDYNKNTDLHNICAPQIATKCNSIISPPSSKEGNFAVSTFQFLLYNIFAPQIATVCNIRKYRIILNSIVPGNIFPASKEDNFVVSTFQFC